MRLTFTERGKNSFGREIRSSIVEVKGAASWHLRGGDKYALHHRNLAFGGRGLAVSSWMVLEGRGWTAVPWRKHKAAL